MPNEVKWAIALLVGIGLIFVGWRVPALLVTVHVLLCFLLIIVVLLQSGKAADLAGAFGGAGSQTAFGPRGAATFLSKATTWCAIMFMLTSMALVLNETRTTPGYGSVLQDIGNPPQKQQTPPPQQPPPAQSQPQIPPAQQAPAQPSGKQPPKN